MYGSHFFSNICLKRHNRTQADTHYKRNYNSISMWHCIAGYVNYLDTEWTTTMGVLNVVKDFRNITNKGEPFTGFIASIFVL